MINSNYKVRYCIAGVWTPFMPIGYMSLESAMSICEPTRAALGAEKIDYIIAK